ncbi:hypothetical protein NP233_g1928 [Leucocoprinus birnbaumii]|uniref:Uncharacterized protein n=1 Tax=Leucocoprinus birnbaumii TaxID=56174 RepID=A0AAD5W177_9AGAR|nr:hypothetical protein NP233_g1928 [Leucocoprinus birnbaumii]
MRERELERDRARIMALREGVASSSPSANSSEYGGHSTSDTREVAMNSQSSGQLQPRPRRISWRRSRQDSQPQTPQIRQDQLRPPPTPITSANLNPSISSPNLRERHQSHHSYSSPPPSASSNTQDLVPPMNLSRSTGSPPPSQGQQPEKKGGWMRRLSMPVGNAFTLDSSKRHANNSNSSTSSNAGVRQLGAGIVGGKGIDEKRNSAMALGIGVRDSREEYGYREQQLQQEQDSTRLGVGLGRKSHNASQSASNLNLGMGRPRY